MGFCIAMDESQFIDESKPQSKMLATHLLCGMVAAAMPALAAAGQTLADPAAVAESVAQSMLLHPTYTQPGCATSAAGGGCCKAFKFPFPQTPTSHAFLRPMPSFRPAVCAIPCTATPIGIPRRSGLADPIVYVTNSRCQSPQHTPVPCATYTV